MGAEEADILDFLDILENLEILEDSRGCKKAVPRFAAQPSCWERGNCFWQFFRFYFTINLRPAWMYTPAGSCWMSVPQ